MNDVSRAARRSMAAPERDAQDLSRLRGMKALLAEDNITNQMVASQMLQTLGVRVDVAHDGQEALSLIRSRPYDLFLVDIEMPFVSGLEVIREIRAAPPPLGDAVVIAVTAYALREHREKVLAAGADGVIAKPITGIDQLGEDILAFAGARLGGASRAPSETPRGAGAQEQETAPISMKTFNSLQESIGAVAMEDLLGKIDADLRKAAADMSLGFEQADLRKVAAATHVMISVGGAIGADELRRRAAALNAAVHAGGETDLSAMGAEIRTQVDEVCAFLRATSP